MYKQKMSPCRQSQSAQDWTSSRASLHPASSSEDMDDMARDLVNLKSMYIAKAVEMGGSMHHQDPSVPLDSLWKQSLLLIRGL